MKILKWSRDKECTGEQEGKKMALRGDSDSPREAEAGRKREKKEGKWKRSKEKNEDMEIRKPTREERTKETAMRKMRE